MRTSRVFRSVAAAFTLALGLGVVASPLHAQGRDLLPAGVVVPAGIGTPPVAKLMPSTRYTAIVRKSIAGTNGFREMVPASSLQDVVLETGDLRGGSLPVTMTVYRFHGDGGKPDAQTIDWKAAFEVAADGSIGNISPEVLEGPMPDALVRKMVLRQLRGLLFINGLGTSDANATNVQVTGVSPRTASTRVDVTFSLDPPKNETLTNTTTTIETTGSALFDSEHGCYIERREKEVSTMYIVDDEMGDSKTLRMETTMSWTVNVSPR